MNLPSAKYSNINEFKENIKYHLLTTRFNNKTYTENQEYIKSKVCIKLEIKCIYCTPISISKKIIKNEIIFVLEMNNEKNEIIGIGMVKNFSYTMFNVYENNKYNRYNYIGKHHITRKEILKTLEGQIILLFLEKYCFTGKKNIKRGSGITIFPIEILYYCSSLLLVEEVIKKIFEKKYDMKLH
jgi:hypothetical protein